MSILKNLKKKSRKKNDTVLRGGIVLLLDTQEQFNKLASCMGLDEDSIEIDGVYVVYMDFQDTLTVHSIFDFCDNLEYFIESCEHKNLKPLDIDVWFKRNKII